jgi:23S rRNA (uracil1939-C5)-methyltransferase
VSGEETTLILDPPRRGLEPGVMAVLGAEHPANVIYVSCAADTLARDTAAIKEHGYELVKARLFDMFPRTPYFETVAWFARG